MTNLGFYLCVLLLGTLPFGTLHVACFSGGEREHLRLWRRDRANCDRSFYNGGNLRNVLVLPRLMYFMFFTPLMLNLNDVCQQQNFTSLYFIDLNKNNICFY
ncbi:MULTISPECIES: hypothetical protein [Nostoc]|uniref:Secreted protein n=2 Tax=Nostoc TaxID=1177 RepID=A0ABR8I870_9NOSO|nr:MULTISPECIES: hypothetical protein [Nostoc]MBD2561527.1 hypothetical protein [Nostoc linckia FACHB-391]MBD2646665.1 hypothetical protein [Nostoc foliaceum FACHB-393]